MKKLFFISLGLALLAVASCGGQEQTTQKEESKATVQKEEAPIDTLADKDATREYVDTLNGHIYHITIERRHDG